MFLINNCLVVLVHHDNPGMMLKIIVHPLKKRNSRKYSLKNVSNHTLFVCEI